MNIYLENKSKDIILIKYNKITLNNVINTLPVNILNTH